MSSGKHIERVRLVVDGKEELFQVSIDVRKVAALLADKALRSKHHTSKAIHGAVVVIPLAEIPEATT